MLSDTEKKRLRAVAASHDRAIGARVKERRIIAGVSQDDLGRALGLTFQQIQKYERGANRIGAGRLAHIARILKTPIPLFFQDVIDNIDFTASETAPPFGSSGLTKEGFEVARAFDSMHDAAVKRQVLVLIKTLAPKDFCC